MSNENKKPEINKAVKEFIGNHMEAIKSSEGIHQLEIRTGDAQKFEYPVKCSILGTLSAPFEFFQKRISGALLHDKNQMHLLVDKLNGVIILITDENWEKGTTVKGAIQKNPFLEKFSINTDRMIDSYAMVKLLKMNKMWFADPEQCGNIVHNLQHFSAAWETEIQKVDNGRGITHESVQRRMKSEIPLSFDLCIEPFKGFSKFKIKVDIGVHYNGDDVLFYFESIDLMQLQLELQLKEIELQVSKFNNEICIFEV